MYSYFMLDVFCVSEAMLLQGAPPSVRTTPSPATSTGVRLTPGLTSKERESPSKVSTQSNGLSSNGSSSQLSDSKDGRRTTSRSGSADRQHEHKHHSDISKTKSFKVEKAEKKSVAGGKEYPVTPVKVENSSASGKEKTDTSCVVDHKGDANITIKHSTGDTDLRTVPTLNQSDKRQAKHKGASETSLTKGKECKSSSKPVQNDEKDKSVLSDAPVEKEGRHTCEKSRKSHSPEKSSSPNSAKGNSVPDKLDSTPAKMKSEPIWSPIDVGVKQEGVSITKDLSKKSPVLSTKEKGCRSGTPSLTASTTICRDLSNSPVPSSSGSGSVSLYSPARMAKSSDKHNQSDSKEATIAVSSPEGSGQYYHYTVSPSQASQTKSRKIHATTFTPEVGTLPSVTLSTQTLTNSCGATVSAENNSGSSKRESRRPKHSPGELSMCLSPRGSVSSSPSASSDTSSNSSPPTVRRGKLDTAKSHSSRTPGKESAQKVSSKRTALSQDKSSVNGSGSKSDNSPKEKGKLKSPTGQAVVRTITSESDKTTPPKPADRYSTSDAKSPSTQHYMLPIDPRLLNMYSEEERKRLMQAKWQTPHYARTVQSGADQLAAFDNSTSSGDKSPKVKVRSSSGSTPASSVDKRGSSADIIARSGSAPCVPESNGGHAVAISPTGEVKTGKRGEIYTVNAMHISSGGGVIKQEEVVISAQKGTKVATVGGIHAVNPSAKKSAEAKSDVKSAIDIGKSIAEEGVPSTSSEYTIVSYSWLYVRKQICRNLQLL